MDTTFQCINLHTHVWTLKKKKKKADRLYGAQQLYEYEVISMAMQAALWG